MPSDMATTEYEPYNFMKYVTFNFFLIIQSIVVRNINNL